jgi:hypothetical protein
MDATSFVSPASYTPGWTIIHTRQDTVLGIVAFALDPIRHYLFF